MSKWVTVQAYASRAEADLVKNMLEQEGIQVRFLSDDAGGMHPELTFSQRVQLQVDESDLEEARAILA